MHMGGFGPQLSFKMHRGGLRCMIHDFMMHGRIKEHSNGFVMHEDNSCCTVSFYGAQAIFVLRRSVFFMVHSAWSFSVQGWFDGAQGRDGSITQMHGALKREDVPWSRGCSMVHRAVFVRHMGSFMMHCGSL